MKKTLILSMSLALLGVASATYAIDLSGLGKPEIKAALDEVNTKKAALIQVGKEAKTEAAATVGLTQKTESPAKNIAKTPTPNKSTTKTKTKTQSKSATAKKKA